MFDILRKAESYILVFGICICAVFYSSVAIDQTRPVRWIIWCAITILLIISISIRTMDNPHVLQPLRRLVFPVFACFIILSCFTMFNAISNSEVVYEVLKLFMILVFLFATTVILRSDRKLFFRVIVFLGIGLSVYGLYEIFIIKPSDYKGTMSCRNLWSAAQLFLLPFCVYQVIKAKKLWRVFGLLASILILTNIFLLLTRSVLLALFISSISITPFIKRKWAISILVFFGALTVIMCFLIAKAPTRLMSTQSLDERLFLWTHTLKMFKDNPAGVGAGNWRIAVAKYGNESKFPIKRGEFLSKIYYRRPHNDILWTLSETGIIGIILYFVIFGLVFFYIYKTGNILAMAGIVAYLVFSCFSFPRERAFLSMMLAIYMAIAIADWDHFDLCRQSLKQKEKNIPSQIVYLSSIIVLGILSFAMVDFCLRYDAEVHAKRIKFLRDINQWDKVLDETKNLTWFSQYTSPVSPILLHEGDAYYFLGYFSLAQKSYERAYKIHPYHPNILVNLGACHFKNGEYETAEKLFGKAVELCPKLEIANKNLKITKKKIKEKDNGSNSKS